MMKLMPCVLVMSAVFLALATGCASAPTVKPPAKPDSASSPPPDNVAASQESAERPPPGDLYADVQNSPLARRLRGEFVLASGPLPFTCFATGKFNIGPERKHLLMKMICIHESDQGIVAMPTEDSLAEPLAGKPYLFDVPFQRSLVSVSDQEDGKTEVVLHYKDDHGEFHHIRLEPRPGARYEYDFDKPLEEVRPIAFQRMMRAGQ